MHAGIWKFVALPLIIGGSISIVYSVINMDSIRVLISEIIVLLLGLLIMLFEKEKRYLAFFITGVFIGIKLISEVVLIYPAIEPFVWVDLFGLLAMVSIGLLLFTATSQS